jgi:ribose/xylose/arabinose/galactoside ABC-type transport system permease subunit
MYSLHLREQTVSHRSKQASRKLALLGMGKVVVIYSGKADLSVPREGRRKINK